MAAVGLSLGSESCVVATSTAVGRYEVSANDAGDRATPTYVAFVGGELLVGVSAKNALVRYPMQTVPHLLPLTSTDIVSDNRFRVACDVEVRESDDKVVFPNVDPDEEEACHDAVELLTQFLARFKGSVVDGACGGCAIKAVTLAVPRYMNSDQCSSLLEAAGYSGKLQVVYNDVAAILAQPQLAPAASKPLAESTKAEVCLVVDWGASTLCLSLLNVAGGLVEHVLHSVSFTCGGKVIDKELQQQLATAFQRKTKMDPRDNSRAMRKLLIVAEEKKKILSTATTTSVEIEAFCEGIDLKEPLSRVKLESIVREKELPQAFERLLDEFLEDYNLEEKVSRITQIVLCGGTLKIPVVVQSVRYSISKFQDQSSKWGKMFTGTATIIEHAAVDEICAIGACVQASVNATSKAKESAVRGSPVKGSGVAEEATSVLPSIATSITTLAADIFLYLGSAADLKELLSAAADVVEIKATDLQLLFPQNSPLPSDVSIEFPAPSSAASSVVLVTSSSAAEEGASTVRVSVASKKTITVPQGTVKVSIIAVEGDNGQGGFHAIAEGADGKKQFLTKEGAIEVNSE